LLNLLAISKQKLVSTPIVFGHTMFFWTLSNGNTSLFIFFTFILDSNSTFSYAPSCHSNTTVFLRYLAVLRKHHGM